MELQKISSVSSVSSGGGNEKDSNQNKKNKKLTKKQGLVEQLNEMFVRVGLPFKILEIDSVLYYSNLEGVVLGEVNESELKELFEQVKLKNSEVERNLTYEQTVPSGNFLDLDI